MEFSMEEVTGIGNSSECAFPFEGNGNEPLLQPGTAPATTSECAFPFEGNGNSASALAAVSRGSPLSLNVPSRLKGIETRGFFWLHHALFSSECAFPFEGNRNSA